MSLPFSTPIVLLFGLPGMILMIRLHVIGLIWFFQVPARRKFSIYFRSLWAALPWFFGSVTFGFIADRFETYIGDMFVGVLALIILGMFYSGLFVHGKRWLEFMLEEGWMGPLGAKREKIWTITVSTAITLIVVRELLKMHS